MEQRSSSGRGTKSEQEGCCGKGHRASLMLHTGPGGHICLLCFSTLISDKNAFLIHRAYAVSEFSLALTDELFRRELLNRHPQLLVTILSDAIRSSTDESFGKDVVDVILSVCGLAGESNEPLLQDFIRQIARQLGCPSPWTQSKCNTLHLMGLLLELHCKQEFCIPQAIKNQQDFVRNLIDGLQLPGEEELQGEILYIFYKLASLDDGVEELVSYSARLCDVAMHALLKTESDVLRINCIALLSVMAGRSLFNIRVGGSIPDQDGNLQSRKGTMGERYSCFARTFAEAMKGPLLSSDLQVQASALRLICFVFPEGVRLDSELQMLIEEGIVDYVFEIIRLSVNQESVQALAVDVLLLLSAEEQLFPHRFKFGLDTVIRVLEKSVDAPSVKLQTNILKLLSTSLSDLAGVVSTARGEHLLFLLTKILQYHAKSVKDHTSVGGTSILPPTFNCACSALISLTQAPSCASIPNVTRILQTAAASAILSATSEANVNPDPSSLIYSARLLQAVYHLNQKQILDDGIVDNTTETLIELCELYLLPAFTDNLQHLDYEELVLTILQTFTLFLKSDALERTYRFASRLASNRCFSLCFELMARFPTWQLKDGAYKLCSALVDKLAGGDTEAYIEEALPHLPDDPTDMLVLLKQRSAQNQQLRSAHHATIAILSTSYSFNDRLAKEIDIVDSMEQHLLVNHGSALAHEIAPKSILKQFVSLYANAKEALLKDCDAAWSVQAENILELIVGRSNCSDLVCSETPKPVLRWILRKESLTNVSKVQIFEWFNATENEFPRDGPQVMSPAEPSKRCKEENESQQLMTLAELIGCENCGTALVISLFDDVVMQGVDDSVKIVGNGVTKLVRMNVFAGHQLIQQGFISSLQQMIRIYESRPSNSSIASCLELLFQLLYDSEPSVDALAVSRSWLDINNQCTSLVLRKMSSAPTFEILVPLSVINMILHKSYENEFFTQERELLVCNKELCAKLEMLIKDASSHPKLSQLDSESIEGELLCSAITFSLLRLRCALRLWHQSDDFAKSSRQYIGFRTPIYSDSDADNSNVSGTSLTCEHWCKILYFGQPTLKMLAICCIVEIFSQLPDDSKSKTNEIMKFKELDMPVDFFTAVTMVLQGSILGDSEQIQLKAGRCLSRLLCSPAVSLQQRRAVAGSPWNNMLIESLVLSLSTPKLNQDAGALKSNVKNVSAASVAVGLLKMSPRRPYLSSLFSKLSITNIVSNLSDDDISPIIVSLFHALLLSKYLTNDHVRVLRDLFQASRRKIYDRAPSLHSSGRQICSKILNVDHSTHHIIHSAILELAVTSRTEALESFSHDVDNSGKGHAELGAFASMLDTFIQDSYLQFE